MKRLSILVLVALVGLVACGGDTTNNPPPPTPEPTAEPMPTPAPTETLVPVPVSPTIDPCSVAPNHKGCPTRVPRITPKQAT